jgi:hypothetical protein
MSSIDEQPAAEDAGSHLSLSRETTPTWEIELLISGAAVFATLGLPRWLDDGWFTLEPRLAADWTGPLGVAYIYAKIAALILCVTFLLHLVLRAHWIALVGLRSVYPDWIRWDKLRAGPVQRRLREARDGGASSVIERADNRATQVFALGWGLFAAVLSMGLLILVLLLVRALVAATVDVSVSIRLWLAAGMLLLLLPLVVADAVDRRLGDRLAPGTRLPGLLGGLFAAYAAIGWAKGANKVVAVLTSQVGSARAAVLVGGLTAGLMVVAVSTSLARREPDRLGSYGLFPSSDPGDQRALDAAHYDDSRDLVTDLAVPFIQSAIVAGPYVRLVVPFDPDRDGAALSTSCSAASTGAREARRLALLACLERLHPLRLDGRPLPVAYDLASDPRTDRPALAAMIDVRGLAPGRHALEVARAPLGTGDRNADEPHLITFWR